MRICMAFAHLNLLLLSMVTFLCYSSSSFFFIADCRLQVFHHHHHHHHHHPIILAHHSNAEVIDERNLVPNGDRGSSIPAINPTTVRRLRLLGAIDHEDYGDPKAPPGMPQAQRGPVVFNHKRKGPKLPPSTKS